MRQSKLARDNPVEPSSAQGRLAVIACTMLLFAALGLLSACDGSLLSQGSGVQPVALLYGVTIYNPALPPGTSPNLSAPENDINTMKSTLEARGWKTIVRKDSAATSSQLAADITSLASTVKAGQRVMFYWCGHGLQYPTGSTKADEQYLGMYGVVRAGLTGYDLGAMVNPSRMASLFKPLSDRNANLIFILDSCYSGGFVSNGTYANGLPDNYSSTPVYGTTDTSAPTHDSTIFADSLASYFGTAGASSSTTGAASLLKPGVWVLAAAGKDEVSWESGTVDHGIFSYFFIDAGTSYSGTLAADWNLDGKVSLQEAYRYCQAGIQKYWNTKYAGDARADYQFKAHLSGNPLDILIY